MESKIDEVGIRDVERVIKNHSHYTVSIGVWVYVCMSTSYMGKKKYCESNNLYCIHYSGETA